MDDAALRRAGGTVRLCTLLNVSLGGAGTSMALPALAYNWPEMAPARLARIGLITVALLLLLVGGLQSAYALRHRPAGAARGITWAGLAALALAVPACITFFWELFRALRLDELDLWSSAVFGPALVMSVSGTLAAANLIAVSLYARALPELAPDAGVPGDRDGTTSTSE